MTAKFKNYASVAFFAFFGGMARVILNNSLSFWGTFFGNITGSLSLALLTYFFLEFEDFYEWLSVGLGTGFIGAFTTFSTFNLDTFKLFQTHHSIFALIYFFSSIIFGFLSAYLGIKLGQYVGKLARKTL